MGTPNRALQTIAAWLNRRTDDAGRIAKPLFDFAKLAVTDRDALGSMRRENLAHMVGPATTGPKKTLTPALHTERVSIEAAIKRLDPTCQPHKSKTATADVNLQRALSRKVAHIQRFAQIALQELRRFYLRRGQTDHAAAIYKAIVNGVKVDHGSFSPARLQSIELRTG
jgi:hypothetical protein